MTDTITASDLLARLAQLPRVSLAQLPTPLQPLDQFSASLGGPAVWMKRDDLTGLAGGGNKTRKLEYLVGDALRQQADTLVTVGAIQSNHTRQTAAAAARVDLGCALLHCAWTRDAGPHYRTTGNVLLSHLLGAELYLDNTKRPIEDQGPLDELVLHLESKGRRPYRIPGGASEHRLGSMGYIHAAAEIAMQAVSAGIEFDYLVHCTGSGSTQAGLLAGFAALGVGTRVIGVSDDGETVIKKARVLRLANDALRELALVATVGEADVEVFAPDQDDYGAPGKETIRSIELLARTEGLAADPVYEGRALHGLRTLADQGRFEADARILLMHLGGTPALHAYAEYFGKIEWRPFDSRRRAASP